LRDLSWHPKINASEKTMPPRRGGTGKFYTKARPALSACIDRRGADALFLIVLLAFYAFVYMAQPLSPHVGAGKTDPAPRAVNCETAATDTTQGQPADPTAAGSNPQSFEAALRELEQTVARMESGELTLEQSLASYKRGAALLQYCQSALADAQQQIKLLEDGMLKDLHVEERDQ
jgi:exodeoxyribonuclease VII small subunit